MTNISESNAVEATPQTKISVGKAWAAVLRIAMLRDPKHKGCRINKIIEKTRKDKLEEPNSLLRRYRDRYSTF